MATLKPFKFDTAQHGSINDNALSEMPLGKHNYVISKITYAPIKADPSGNRHHLIIELRHESGKTYTQFIEHVAKNDTESEATRARIAGDEFNAYVAGCGIKKGVVLTAAKFKLLYKKLIGIETTESKNKSSGKVYINTTQVVAGGWKEEDKVPLDDGGEEDVEEDVEEDDAPIEDTEAVPASPEDEEEEDDEEDDNPFQ